MSRRVSRVNIHTSSHQQHHQQQTNTLSGNLVMDITKMSTTPPTTSTRPSWFVVQVTAIASVGGILFGYDLGVIAGALPQLIRTFELSSKSAEVVVSVLYLGGGFGLGASLGGSICDTFGRKRAIFYVPTLSLPTFILGRIIVGFGVAVNRIADANDVNEHMVRGQRK